MKELRVPPSKKEVKVVRIVLIILFLFLGTLPYWIY